MCERFVNIFDKIRLQPYKADPHPLCLKKKKMSVRMFVCNEIMSEFEELLN